MDLQDIPGLNGADNMPGIGTEIYFIPRADLQTIQTPASGAVDITEHHVPKPGKGFYKMYLTLETGELTSEMKGNIDGRYQGQMLKGLVPGVRSSVAEIIRKAQNVECIVIAPEANGKFIQLGDAVYPAYLGVSTKTGRAGGDDTAGFDIEFKSYGIATLFYPGIPPLKSDFDGEAVINISAAGAEGDVPEVVVTLQGVPIVIGSFTVPASPTAAAVATGLAAAIEANAYDFGATASGSTITITEPASPAGVFRGAVVSLNNAGTVEFDSTLADRTL